jgi:small subunit ribosomal protein S29e
MDWTTPMTKGAYLDAAVSMAKVEQCPSQVDFLVNQLKTTYKDQVNFEEDWKLLTLFIGANNICEICKNDTLDQPDYFEKHLREVLGLIEQKIPKVFVNVMTIFVSFFLLVLVTSGFWDAVSR